MRHPRADAAAQQAFHGKIEGYELDGRSIVYIDGSGFAHDMPRTHGYAPKGQRCIGEHDWNAKGRVNVIGALLTGVLLSDDLIPKLPPVSVPVMNRATFHRRSDTEDAIKAAGHTFEYLPAYSPEFNDIEHKWAEAKSCRRKTGKTVEEIFKDTNWNQN